MSILTGVVKAFGSKHSRGDKILMIGDSSGSMTAILRDGVTRFDAQGAVMRDMYAQHDNMHLGLFSSTAMFIEHPDEIAWCNGLDGGTRFAPIFRLANSADIDHLYIFSDGEPFDETSEIFSARGAGNYKISTFFFGTPGSPGEALMESLVRGGKAYVIDSAEELRAAVSAESGIDLGADQMSAGIRPRSLPSVDVRANVDQVSNRLNFNSQVADLAGRVNDVAHRVGTVELRQLVTDWTGNLLGQIDAQGAQVLERHGEQYRADELARDNAAKQLSSNLTTLGGQIATASAQRFEAIVSNGAQVSANLLDRSAPVALQPVNLSAEVFGRASALLAAHANSAPALPSGGAQPAGLPAPQPTQEAPANNVPALPQRRGSIAPIPVRRPVRA